MAIVILECEMFLLIPNTNKTLHTSPWGFGVKWLMGFPKKIVNFGLGLKKMESKIYYIIFFDMDLNPWG
ncbi:hypothetical protein BpHYR1_037473 [Brachionus plicatilis]|uniref:Uncharacterized protein n=1 Tax=Brachionus plicatilis TaxID=10195 RepID=A0A3M7RCW7_BRAPC|nr:hypothetical protein BpHYR1_037473 [Brachionus plicatilis]